MSHAAFSKFMLINSLFATSLAAGISSGASAGARDTPAAQSDGISSAASDTVITAKVKSQFVGEEGLKKSVISVTTVNGVVTLTGSAPSAAAQSDAETIARAVAGVKSVDDQLDTGSPTGTVAAKVGSAVAKTKQIVSDSWITTEVKSEILADSVSKGFAVKVRTKHGVVRLKGALASQGAIDHVKDLAGQVKGVKSVNSSLLTVASS